MRPSCTFCDWAFCSTPCETCPAPEQFRERRTSHGLYAAPLAAPGTPVPAEPAPKRLRDDDRLAAAGEFIATWRRWMGDIEAGDPELLLGGATVMEAVDRKTADRLRIIARHLAGELATANTLNAGLTRGDTKKGRAG